MNARTFDKHTQKQLDTMGYRKCSAPKIPYRVVQVDPLATMTYNKLYLMGFMDGLNGGDCSADIDGKVTTRRCHWVTAVPATDENIPDSVAAVYMVGIETPVAFVVRGGTSRNDVVDFTDTCQVGQKSGMW